MKFNIAECEISTGSHSGKFFLSAEHLPTGKRVKKEMNRPLTEGDRILALQELSDLIEGRTASERQLLVEGA